MGKKPFNFESRGLRQGENPETMARIEQLPLNDIQKKWLVYFLKKEPEATVLLVKKMTEAQTVGFETTTTEPTTFEVYLRDLALKARGVVLEELVKPENIGGLGVAFEKNIKRHLAENFDSYQETLSKLFLELASGSKHKELAERILAFQDSVRENIKQAHRGAYAQRKKQLQSIEKSSPTPEVELTGPDQELYAYFIGFRFGRGKTLNISRRFDADVKKELAEDSAWVRKQLQRIKDCETMYKNPSFRANIILSLIQDFSKDFYGLYQENKIMMNKAILKN